VEASQGKKFIVVDNASDAFGGDENVRRHVRMFIRRLAEIPRDNDAALMLLAHIDKFGAKNGTSRNSYSGSTAWHNSVRSRLALIDDPKTGLQLRHEKCNLAKLAPALVLKWQGPVLVPGEPVDDESAGDAQLAKDAGAVLAAIRKATDRGETINAARSGPDQLYHNLRDCKDLPSGLKNRSARQHLHAVVDRLLHDGALREEPYTTEKSRNARTRLVPTEADASMLECVSPPVPPAHTHAGERVCAGLRESIEQTHNSRNSRADENERTTAS
jgi:RecA-family ATPase